MISLAVCSVCMAGLGACYYIIESYGKKEAEIASWMALVCLILNTLSFMAGLAPVPWVLVGELLPGIHLTSHNRYDYHFFNGFYANILICILQSFHSSESVNYYCSCYFNMLHIHFSRFLHISFFVG